MILRESLNSVHRLDEWLKERLGRPYHAILGIGLVIEIVRHLREAVEIGSETGIIKAALAVILFAALLTHQLAELSEHAERRRSRAAVERRDAG